MHLANCKWFGSEWEAFYQDVVKDDERLNVFLDDFRKAIGWHIKWPLLQKDLKAPESPEITLYWNQSKSLLQIFAPVGAQGVTILNQDAGAKAKVVKALQSIYRYAGPFEFDDDDIPF
ncbi:MAG: hypothetical protein ABI728_06520 [Betaproteobacteria bacterium]